MKTYRLALIGFGSVGQGLAQILERRGSWLQQRYGLNLPITAVSTRSWGTLYDPAGLDPRQLLQAAEAGNVQGLPRMEWNPLQMLAKVEADVLVEISATDLQTAEPATSHMHAAINRRMHVVTANKGPIALYGQELMQRAQAAGVGLGYEGTVMSGTPALRMGWSNLAGCEVTEVRGILNGTTNYMLTRMEQGLPYADALSNAQQLGYAEADPSGDVEGYDAAGKAIILANMLFEANLRMEHVACTGITQLTPDDIAAAAAAGERWKLIARVAREGDQVTASVQPTRLPLSHPLAGVGGASNAITFATDLLGDVTVIGPGAGGVATGFALLADLLALHAV